MEDPQEHKLSGPSLTVVTKKEIETLKTRGRIGLVSLTVADTAIDFQLLATVLVNNYQTIKTLSVTHNETKLTHASPQSFQQFQLALYRCVNLNKLEFKHSGEHLDDNFNDPEFVLAIMKMATQSRLKVLHWNPEPVYQSKISDLQNHLSFPQSDQRLQNKRHECEYKLYQYRRALKLLPEIRKLLAERQNKPQKNVLIEIPDENNFYIELVTATILFHSSEMECLTIRMLNTAQYDPYLSHFDPFLMALSQCQNLRSFKLETFQGAFVGPQIEGLFQTISKLPLRALSFNKTYIGLIGFQCLAKMAEQTKLVEIDLTLSGLTCNKSVGFLAQFVRNATSLQSVSLGRSPMTLNWWQILNEASRSNFSRPTIAWQITHEEEMKAKMRIMQSCITFNVKELDEIESDSKEFNSEVVNIDQKFQTFVSGNRLFAFYGVSKHSEREKLINRSSGTPPKNYGMATPKP